MAVPPLYSEDAEDSLLRNFLDEEMDQNAQTSSPIREMPEENGYMANPAQRNDSYESQGRHSRSSRTREHSHTTDLAQGSDSYESERRHSRSSHTREQSHTADPAQRNESQRLHSRSSRTKKHSRHTSSSASSKNPEELRQRLMEQTHEAHTLRRALQLAVARMRENANEAAQTERSRVQAQTAEYFHKLNESRIAAQQEALQASQDLRIYQVELQSAQEEVRRARELLSMAEQERHGAVQAAEEAREQTRELYKRYMMDYSWHSGRDDAMRAGIEEGLLRERMRMYGDDTIPPEPPFEGRPLRPIQPVETAPPQSYNYSHSQTNPNESQLTYANANIQHRYEDPPPNIQVVSPSGVPTIQQPVPITFPHPEPALDQRAPSPGVQIYSLDIPSATVLERQYSTRSVDPVRKSKGPWLTAEQHMALRNLNPNTPNEPQPPQPATNVTFQEPVQPEQLPKKPKESWYHTIRRKLSGKKPKQEPIAPYGPYSKYASGPEPQEPPSPPQPQSWYVPRRGPHIHSPEVGMPIQPPVDSITSSIVTPPAESNASQRSGRSGNGTRSHRGRAESLSIIVEDPMSGMPTPLQSVRSGQPKLRSVSMDQGDMASLHPSIGQSSYAQPAAMDNWISSTATGRESQNPQQPPTRGPRRPAKMTVPAPLALDVPGSMPPGAFETTGILDASGLLKPPGRSSRSLGQYDPVAPPQASAPIDISVQSPSNSPSETTGSALPDRGYLSPSASSHVPIPQPSMHSLANSRTSQQSHTEAAPVARPPSRSHHLASPTPVRSTDRSLPGSSQAPPNLLGLSSPNDPFKPPVPRKSPMPTTTNLPPGEAARPVSRASQRTRATVRVSPEQKTRSVSGHMRVISDPQWGDKTPSVRSRKTTLSTEQGGPETPAGSMRERNLIRVPSNTSLNIPNSPYAKFKSMDYVDPAFFDHNGAGYSGALAPQPAQPPRGGTPSMRSHHSRAASSQSSLGFYIDDPKLKLRT